MRLSFGRLAALACVPGMASASTYVAPEHALTLRLTALPSGTIDDCAVSLPSDRPDQDHLACDLLRQRGRAYLKNDAPIVVTTKLRWRSDVLSDESAYQPEDARLLFLPMPNTHWLAISDYPDELLHGGSVKVKVRFAVMESGRAGDCRSDGQSGNPALDSWTCKIVEGRRLFRRAVDPDGRPIRYWSDNQFFWAPAGIRVCDSGDACK